MCIRDSIKGWQFVSNTFSTDDQNEGAKKSYKAIHIYLTYHNQVNQVLFKGVQLVRDDGESYQYDDEMCIRDRDMSSGSLGQGISAAVGMAIAGKLDNADYRVYTLLGDGEIQEGQVWEAAMLAAHKKLDNLVVIVDNNNLQIDGAIDEVNSPYPVSYTHLDVYKRQGFHRVQL